MDVKNIFAFLRTPWISWLFQNFDMFEVLKKCARLYWGEYIVWKRIKIRREESFCEIHINSWIHSWQDWIKKSGRKMISSTWRLEHAFKNVLKVMESKLSCNETVVVQRQCNQGCTVPRQIAANMQEGIGIDLWILVG